LAEGPFLRQRLIDLGCPPEKVEIQRIAIPVKQMPFRPRRPRPDGKVIIVFAGRFCEQKGLLYALEAVRETWRERRGIEFRIIGDERLTGGEYAIRVYSYIRRNHLEDCVRLLGFLNHQDYLRHMEQGDIFIHPSIMTSDGIGEGGAPTTILEAQALGMPIVSTYHCDIPNVTLPGQSAILVPEKNGKALAHALQSLLNHPERWEKMGQLGRKHMERFHDIDREVLILEGKYYNLMNRMSIMQKFR
jgi:colanic acid/amylovoran biosynthesis glycosyltransferase